MAIVNGRHRPADHGPHKLGLRERPDPHRPQTRAFLPMLAVGLALGTGLWMLKGWLFSRR